MLTRFLDCSTSLSSSPCFFRNYSQKYYSLYSVPKLVSTSFFIIETPKLKKSFYTLLGSNCNARRRIRYEDEGDEDDDEYGYNEELAMLETYTQSARNEALIVKAMVDEQELEVLIFKGFSSCLNSATFADPTKSVLPARAVIRSIDRVEGPINPSNIQYIEQGLTFEVFKTRL